MKFLPLPLLALIAAGCAVELDEPKHAANAPAPSSETAATVQVPTDPRHNPKRAYQLADLDRADIKVAKHTIKAYVMDTPGMRAEGMMWLTDKEVKANDGFLFVFPHAEPQSFWMENTLIPLDLIYISKSQTVLNVQHGKPLDRTGLPSKGEAQYVLEMKGGAAKRLGIGPGTKCSIPKSVVARG